MKKPEQVVAAEAAVRAKEAEVQAATDELARLRTELEEARAALQAAELASDSGLPQCSLIQKSSLARSSTNLGLVVILRKTPGGMLVVRKAGDQEAPQMRFKRNKLSAVFTHTEKGMGTRFFELQDVPAEYLAASDAASDED